MVAITRPTYRRLPGLLLLLLLTAACQPALVSAPTVLPPQLPTLGPTLPPVPAASPTPVLAAMQMDESTQAAPTVLPAQLPTSVPTQPSVPAASPTPVLAAMQMDEWTQASPDGRWVASGLAALPAKGGGLEYYARLAITQVGADQEWIVVDEWRPTGLGWTSPVPLRWSADGSAFYFTNLPHPDGCALLTNGTDLHRLDLATGVVTELLPEAGLWVSLSPDESQIAYIGYGDRGLVIRDIATGAEHATTLALPAVGAQAGAVVWSPDASRLALTVVHDPCASASPAHSILVLEMATGVITTVLDEAPGQYITSDWPEPDRLSLTGPLGPLWLDLTTGQLSGS